jgi:hypothetical protein
MAIQFAASIAQGIRLAYDETVGRLGSEIFDRLSLRIAEADAQRTLATSNSKRAQSLGAFETAGELSEGTTVGLFDKAGTATQITGGMADPADIRFSQPIVSPFFDNGKRLDDAIANLRANPGTADAYPAIRVVRHQGILWTLDNRRLVVFQAAGIKQIPVQEVSLSDPKIRDEFFGTSTKRGKFNPIRDGTVVVVTVRKTRPEALRLLESYKMIRKSR